MKKLKKILSVTSIFIFLTGISLINTPTVSADTSSISANINWDEPGCQGIVNGSVDLLQYGVKKGDSVTLTIHNQAAIDMQFTVDETTNGFSTGPILPAGGSRTFVLSNLQSDQIINTGHAVSTNCTGYTSAAIYIVPTNGTIVCTDEAASKQKLSYTFNSKAAGLVSVFSGATLVDTSRYQGIGSYVMNTVTASKTFQLRAGTSSSDRLLAETTCNPPSTTNPGSTTPTGNTGSSQSNSAPAATNKSSTPKTATSDTSGIAVNADDNQTSQATMTNNNTSSGTLDTPVVNVQKVSFWSSKLGISLGVIAVLAVVLATLYKLGKLPKLFSYKRFLKR